MEKQSKSVPWLSMKPGPGPKAAPVVVAAEVVDTAVADTVVVAAETAEAVVDMEAAADMVTSAVVAEMVADGVADASDLLLEDFGCQDS